MILFHMPELISIKQGRDQPKNFTNWYKIMKNVKFEWNLYVHLTEYMQVILKFKVQESIFMNLFKRKEGKL